MNYKYNELEYAKIIYENGLQDHGPSSRPAAPYGHLYEKDPGLQAEKTERRILRMVRKEHSRLSAGPSL